MHRLIDYFSKHFIQSIYALALFIGMGVLILYYSKINYLPEVDLYTLIYILIAVTAISLFLFIILSGCFCLPGFMGKLFYLKELKYFNDNKEAQKSLIAYLYLPCLFYISFLLILEIYNRNYNLFIFLFTLILLLPIVSLLSMYFFSKIKLDFHDRFIFSFYQIKLLVLYCAFVYISYKLANFELGITSLDKNLLIIAVLFLITLINIIFIQGNKKINPIILTIGCMCAALLLMADLLNIHQTLITRTASLLALRIEKPHLFLNEAGCEIIEYVTSQKIIRIQPGKCEEKRMNILSTLGSEYLLEYKDAKGVIHQFTMPKVNRITRDVVIIPKASQN